MNVKLVKAKIVRKDLKRKRMTYEQRKIRTTNRKTGTSLDKPIQYYRIWFRYLKLCLELESLKVRFFRQNKFGKSTGKGLPVKVNRKKYEGWDLDQVLDSTFDRWWESYRHLFDERSIEVMKEGDIADSNKDFGYFKIDLRKKKRQILNELDVHLKLSKQHQKPHKTTQFKMEGRFEHDSILLRYNVFIRDFNGEIYDEIYDMEDRFDDTDKKITKIVNTDLDSRLEELEDMYERFAMTKQEYELRVKKVKEDFGNKSTFEEVNKLDYPQELKTDIRRLVRDSQKILLGVCQGGFVRRLNIS